MTKQILGDSIEFAISDSAVQDTTATILDTVLDASIDDGLLRDIPLVGLLLGIGRAVVTVSDRLFVNKLCHLLQELESVPIAQRREMIAKINDSSRNRVKVGEKLLYIIDRCEDHVASQNVGRVFKAYLEGNIEYDEFLRLSAAIDRLLAADLETFLNREWTHVPAYEATVYLSSGLIEFDESEIRVEDEWDRKMERKYRVEYGESTVSITKLGRTLQALLRPETFARNPNESCHV